MFVKIYLDENISHLVAQILRSRGYEVLTAQEAGNKGLSDDKQLGFACNLKMAILNTFWNYYCLSSSATGNCSAFKRNFECLHRR